MTLRTMIWVAGIVGLASAASKVSAQEPGQHERENNKLQQDCRLAVQILSAGQPNPHRNWAQAIITTCDESGPEALRREWGVTTTDANNLDWLVDASSRLRDARLLGTVTSVAEDPAQPVVVRLSALRVLISYYSPDDMASLAKLSSPPTPTAIGWCCLDSRTDFVPMDGSSPLPPNVQEVIKSALETIATRDGDAIVRRAAEFVFKNL